MDSISNDSAEVFDRAIKSTTFSKAALEMLTERIAGVPKHTGIVTMRLVTDIDGVQFGEPAKITAALENGKIHREVGPAVVITDTAFSKTGEVINAKTAIYMKNGVPDRVDGPALITANSDMLWMQNGQLNRTNGPAGLIDNKPIFAINGKVLTADEFGKQAGLGVQGKDWMVEPNTGTTFSNLTGVPAVLMMKDVSPAGSTELHTSMYEKLLPAPKLTGNAVHVDSASKSLTGFVTALQEADPVTNNNQRVNALLAAINRDSELGKAKLWVDIQKMPMTEKTKAVISAIDNPSDKDRMKPFDKYINRGVEM